MSKNNPAAPTGADAEVAIGLVDITGKYKEATLGEDPSDSDSKKKKSKATPKKGNLLVRVNNVYRDAIQSLFGTSWSAREIINGMLHAGGYGFNTMQTGGGTFLDVFARNGRNEWEVIEEILTHAKEQGIRQTCLVRGDCMFGYEPASYEVIKKTVREYALMGMNVFQNFHGLNDIDAMRSVAQAVNEVREELEAEGNPVDIQAQGVICIEDNPNITVESCLEFAEELIKSGHKGFYLKSASGRLKPEFVAELTAALIEKFPDETIDIHAHTTYGEAEISLEAAIREGVKRGHPIGIDVQHEALSGSTAHPGFLKMIERLENDPDPAIREQGELLREQMNFDAIEADSDYLYKKRLQHRDSEITYNKELFDAMYAARAPGGASSTLRKIPGLEASLGSVLGTNDWVKIQIAVYKMQAEILDDLGQPTQVTPYAFLTTNQAAMCLLSEMQARKTIKAANPNLSDAEVAEKAKEHRWDRIHPSAAGYLTGELGKVPESANPELIKKALKQRNMEEVKKYIPACERDSEGDIAETIEILKEAGIEDPTDREIISTSMTWGDKKKAAEHVVKCRYKTNEPKEQPAFPDYIAKRGYDFMQAMGGIPAVEKIAQKAQLYKQLQDGYAVPSNDNLNEDGQTEEEALIAEISEFILQAKQNIMNAEGLDELTINMHLNTLDGILQDIFDNKATGLNAEIREEIMPAMMSTPIYYDNDTTFEHDGMVVATA